MLKRGSIVLSIWCGINFILAFIILCYVIVLKQNSPILQVASFSAILLMIESTPLMPLLWHICLCRVHTHENYKKETK